MDWNPDYRRIGMEERVHAVGGSLRIESQPGGGTVVEVEVELDIGQGPGSVTAAYRVEDWVRAVRHGVKPDGRPIRIMPSEDYNRMTDADLGATLKAVGIAK